jgi:hypothetical protein
MTTGKHEYGPRPLADDLEALEELRIDKTPE